MDTKPTTLSGHESHGVHLCHRCGWPFPKPHPSARHRRAHKKICGTIEGYTTLIDSGPVSDDEHHPDEDLEKTPSPEFQKINIIKESAGAGAGGGSGGGGLRGRSGRSEEDLFSDAVTEFSESGTSPGLEDRSDSNKTLDRDLFFSFKDAENGGNNELINSGSNSSGTVVEVKEERAVPISIPEEAKNTEIHKASEASKTTIESAPTGEDDEGEEEKKENLSDVAVSDQERVPEVVKESETEQSEETKHVESEPDHELVQEVVKESGIDEGEEIKHEKFEYDHECSSEVVEKGETDLGAPGLDKSSKEQPEVVLEEPSLGSTERVDLDASELQKHANEHTQEVVEEPSSVLTEKADVGAPEPEKCSKEHAQEVVEEPSSVLPEKADLDESDSSVLATKVDLGAPSLEKCVKDETLEAVEEPKTENKSKVVVEGVGDSSEKSTPKEAEQSANDSVCVDDAHDIEGKSVSDVVSNPIGEEINHKPMNNQDSAVDLSVDSSSHNSLEGNWGSVSVLSTASVEDKSKADTGKPVAAEPGSTDVIEPPSFMTLLEPKGDTTGQKPGGAAGGPALSEVQDSQPKPNPEEPQAGWFPTLTNVSNESEGRKRNEEVIAKVTNWTTGKQQSTPLKNLLGEAKSPNSKPPPVTMVQKDEALVTNQDSSPPKLIEDGKKVRKKSWVPFVCCSSVNVVN